MATESGGREPSLLQHDLTVLAQFEDERAVLAPRDIERLAGVSCSTAQRCLVTLSELGYLAPARDGRYRLARSAVGICVQRDEDDTASTQT